MMERYLRLRRLPRSLFGRLALAFTATLSLLAPVPARASCNVIPAATQEFRGALGSVNRPFAGPDEWVELRVGTGDCDRTSTGFVDSEDQYVVTIVFKPPGTSPPSTEGQRNAVVLADPEIDPEICTHLDLQSCLAGLGGGSAVCMTADLRRVSASELQFRFPDTGQLPYSGPAKLVASRLGAELHCEAATCAELGGSTATNGVVACVDELYPRDGTCRTDPGDVDPSYDVDPIFGHFTALPPPNDFATLCTPPQPGEPPCLDLQPDLRFTTDRAGNALVPMNYTGVLRSQDGVPVAQLADATIGIEAEQGGGAKVALSRDRFIRSYSPEGVPLPPVFTPLSNPSDPNGDAILFGAVDAARAVIRIARRGCEEPDREGEPCDLGCTCSDPLFEFRDRYELAIGPVLISPGNYTAKLGEAVPLEGLIEGDGAFGFVLSEALPTSDGSLVSRNVDSDTTDFVATLRDRETGIAQPIGTAGSDGRAVVRVHEAPFFSFPAVETSGDLLVFLESEPLEGDCDPPNPPLACDTNANGAVFDSLLRVFRLDPDPDPPMPTDVLAGANVTADAAPLVNGRSFALSNCADCPNGPNCPKCRVFFRTSEAAEADQLVRIMSVRADGSQPDGQAGSSSAAISGDGRFVAFESRARLVPEDLGNKRDIYVRDRDLDADGGFDEPGQIGVARLSVDSGEVAANFPSRRPAITRDGRFVAFESDATNLALETNGIDETDAFLRDRDPDQDGILDEADATTERVGLADDESEPDGHSLGAQPTPDGRFVAFQSVAADVVPDDANDEADIFVRDRAAGTTARVSLAENGSEGDGSAGAGPRGGISADGRYVLFSSDAPLVAGDMGNEDVFVRDRVAASTSRVDITSFAAPVSGGRVSGVSPLTPDGRFLVFESEAPELVGPGVTGIFVHDRDADGDGAYGEAWAQEFPDLPEISTTRADVSSEGVPFDGVSGDPSLSADGRFVALDCMGMALCSGGVYLHDTVTGHSVRAGEGESPALSADGRYVAFESDAYDANGARDVFVRGPDPQDLAADRSGDGDPDDIVLRVVDTAPSPATITDLCPAQDVAVAGDNAVFLRPEAAGISTTESCPQPAAPPLKGPDLNLDGDDEDAIVQLWRSDALVLENLQCAATAVALSATRVAALVSEAGQGADFNDDDDTSDRVLFVRGVGHYPDDPPPTACIPGVGSDWVNTQQTGEAIALSGDRVVLLTREASEAPGNPACSPSSPQGSCDLNGDGDALDRVVRLVDGESGALVPIFQVGEDPDNWPQAAEDFVVGTSFVAFRTSEAAQGRRLNTVDVDGVGGTDQLLDDDVLQLYLLTGELVNTQQTVRPCFLAACDAARPYRVSPSTVRFLTFEPDQMEDLDDDLDQDDLLVQVYNIHTRQSRVVGEIVIDAAVAEDPSTSVDPFDAPQPDRGRPAPGEQVLVAEGRCMEAGASCDLMDPQCPPGQACVPPGVCLQDVGQTCSLDKALGEEGCSPSATCESDLVAIGVADADGDEVPDFLDNCPADPNVAQQDLDQDGFGDACDAATCSNGLPLEPGEECDDTNLVDGDGCDSNCRFTACGNGIPTDPEQCDDGNALALDGCTAACGIEVADSWTLGPAVMDGFVSFRIGGVEITVATAFGQTAQEVAASVADAIRAEPALVGHAVHAAAIGATVISNAAITDRTTSGIGPVAVPSLGAPGLAALAAGLLLAGLLALRRARRALL